MSWDNLNRFEMLNLSSLIVEADNLSDFHVELFFNVLKKFIKQIDSEQDRNTLKMRLAKFKILNPIGGVFK